MKANHVLLFYFLLVLNSVQAQVLTKEDSLTAGLIQRDAATVLSGYGSIKYQHDVNNNVARANVDRVILFVGHKFSKKISFFSELELEDAKVAGGEAGGEIALEQAFLKFNVNNDLYITAGLFTPRIGIINENHLPTTFNGNDRPFVETLIIPATWREIGIGLYGNVRAVPGLNYSAALVNGLNSAGFENGSGIKGGRFEGRDANASALAVTGALLYYIKNFRVQASAYYGGSVGLTKNEADSLLLVYGSFGTPVGVYEGDVQYHNKGLSVKALVTTVQIPDAKRINRAYANNTPEAMLGYYGEIGYNVLRLFKETEKNLTAFVRYENLNMNYKLPSNGLVNGTIDQQYVIGGLTFQPVRGVTVKADYIFKSTGDVNPALVINPFPTGRPYQRQQGFFSLGVGYSF
ncbi:MAG TPA: hypothetical protein VFF27_13000 [Bacteroidia bacterium]|jgi:hypothetical protein|nr:hypothetical protein [Bacteroidia bacterium]